MGNASGGQAALATAEGEVDRVYRTLRNWILQCEFRPGDFLAEVELARRCETSRTPIREACNRLAQEGWIAQIRHKGYMVPQISVRDIVDIYEFRKLLECFNAEKAARVASPEQLATLRGIIEAEQKPKPAMSDILAANEAFHIGLGNIANNQRVMDQLKLALEYVHRLDVLSTQRDTEWVPHGEILSALEKNNPAQARRAMAAHIDHSRDRMLKLFGS
jgi:DNA-binding GntR family transcriptional regulator